MHVFLIDDKRITCITTVEVLFYLMKESVANPSNNVTQGKISLPLNIEEIRRGWLSGGEIPRQKRHPSSTFAPLICVCMPKLHAFFNQREVYT